MSADEVAAHWRTNLQAGLTHEEVIRRRAEHGLNALREAKPLRAWRIFAAQFRDFMIAVLLGAAVIAGVVGEPVDALAIVAIVLLNALIGFVQEFRAQRALATLRSLAAHPARVLRGGQAVMVPALELVPGDVVVVEAGNQVPADLRMGEAAQLRINESALTGESLPAEKQTAAHQADALGDRLNMAFKGTLVTAGRGRGIVVATGMRTELGRIAKLLEQRVDTQTPLQARLARFGRVLTLGALAICGVVFLTGVLRGEPWVSMLLTAVSLAAAAIPEALPAVVTITLAMGARKMLRANTLVRRLPAVETLGSVTVVCSDKTGTLTENRMRVTDVWVHGDRVQFYTALVLCNDATADSGDPTEIALIEAAVEAGLGQVHAERTGELPFDSERKRMTTMHSGVAYMKGAPESVAACCVDAPAEALGRAAQLASQGLRVLAVATRAIVDEAVREEGFTFLGLVGMMDPPRAEAREAVAQCVAAGITPVMITGDHPATALAIARQLGIAREGDVVVTGAELRAMASVPVNARVYARVDPAQKVQIVEALQARGEYVAMTGDGVNDAPALQRADIGIAMGRTGTDAAREAADLVLLDDNFATIVKAVREGRHIFDNIRKFVKFAMASNSAEIWTMLLAPFLGLPIPLLPIHILWTNLVTDGLPGLALAAEPESRDVMQRPPRPPSESLLAHGAGAHMVWVGLLIAALSLGSQAWAIESGSAHWQTVVFTVLTLCQMAHVLALGSWRNRPLLGAVACTVLLQGMVVYVPTLQRVFKTAPLTAAEVAGVVGVCAGVFLAVAVEARFRGHRRAS
jgi:Ca2+-transporting ATPase